MIWLFKVNEVFWGNKPKVNSLYKFDISDINFDITNYDIDLYFNTASYYVLDDNNDNKVYQLIFESVGKNPTRILLSDDHIIKNFYKENNGRAISNIRGS